MSKIKNFIKISFISSILFPSSSCVLDYEKSYTTYGHSSLSKKYKLEKNFLNREKSSKNNIYKVNSLVDMELEMPKVYDKKYTKEFVTERTYGLLKENEPLLMKVAYLPFIAVFTPLSLLADIGVLTSGGHDIDKPKFSRKSYVEASGKYPYCDSISQTSTKINLEYLTKLDLLNTYDASFIHLTKNQNKKYNNFNKDITEDYKLLNQLGIKLISKDIKLSLNSHNINKLNEELTFLYNNLTKLCSRTLPADINQLFTSKEKHIFTKYGIDQNYLTLKKVTGGNKILLIDENIAQRDDAKVTYTAYYIDDTSVHKNVKNIIPKVSNFKLVKLNFIDKNGRKANQSNFEYYNNFRDIRSSDYELLTKIKNQNIREELYYALYGKLRRNDSHKNYYLVPKNKRFNLELTVRSHHYKNFSKNYILTPNQKILTIKLADIPIRQKYENAPFYMKTGEMRANELNKLYKTKLQGINNYTRGRQYLVNTKDIDFPYIKKLIAMFDKKGYLVAIESTFPQQKFHYVNHILSKKYSRTQTLRSDHFIEYIYSSSMNDMIISVKKIYGDNQIKTTYFDRKYYNSL